MGLTRVSNWCTTLKTERKYPLTKEEILDTWKPVQEDLTLEEQTLLLTVLVKTDSVFKWLHLISYFLPDLFSESQYFINLMELVIDKIKNDMAQGVFIRALIDSGEKKPDIALKLYSSLSTVANDVIIPYSGLFLGGAARKRFDEAFRVIKNDLQRGKTSVKVACIKALRVTFETEDKERFPPEILDLLEQMSKIGEPSIQYEVISAYVDFDRFNPEECEQKLVEIVTTGDSSARFAVSNRLWLSNLADQKREIELLKICADDNDSAVLANVARALSRKGQAFLKDSLEITKKILKNYKDFNTSEIDYLIAELCKNDVGTCLATFEEWEKSEQGTEFQFRISRLSEKLQMRK